MERHLIIGISGQVGAALATVLRSEGTACAGTYASHPVDGAGLLDIRDRSRVEALVSEIRAPAVYLPAAMTNVDGCESDPAGSAAINVEGVRNVAGAVKRTGGKLVYFSTDYIFDGRNGPYREDDPPRPVSEYGRQKLDAERLVASGLKDFLIVRTTGVYGWESQGKNFVFRLVEELKAGRTFRVPSDQFANPAYAPNLALATAELVRSGAKGVWHIAGATQVSRYEFAREAARIFGMDEKLIQGVPTAQLGQKAGRPLRGGLVTEKAQAVLRAHLMDYREGLQAMKDSRPESK